jgi:bacteriocin biosynthesis cyclodehydratase domain-containing protein
MVLKLDGRHAIVWRDPFSLQLGVDPARVVLRDVSTADERMIAALRSGVSRSGLDMIAASAGATEREVVAVLRAVKPLLLSEPDAPTSARVAIVGRGQTVDRIASTLALAGISVTVSASAPDESADLGILVGHYVLEPDSYGFWLRRDRPHLPVVFGDDSVLIGPLVEPGRTPCLFCLEHYRRDADASWSAIASQLWGRRSRSESALVSAEVAARVSRLVLRRLDGAPQPGRSLAARSFRLAADTGEVTRRDWMPHPDCGCVAIPDLAAGVVSADRPESDSAAGSDQPRTASASGALA